MANVQKSGPVELIINDVAICIAGDAEFDLTKREYTDAPFGKGYTAVRKSVSVTVPVYLEDSTLNIDQIQELDCPNIQLKLFDGSVIAFFDAWVIPGALSTGEGTTSLEIKARDYQRVS